MRGHRTGKTAACFRRSGHSSGGGAGARVRHADDNGIVLIADEVQSGFARTGTMFGIEHSGIRPDLITVAKALGGGFPLSGVIGRADVMDAVDPGGLGGTYAGSPIACAAALAVLDVIEEQNLCARSRALGERVVAHANDLDKGDLKAQAREDKAIVLAQVLLDSAFIGA